MGNSNTKRSDDSSSNSIHKKKEFVDQQINYGSLVTHGIYTTPPEYDIDVVREFILKKKLSPFYKGMEEYSDNPFPNVLASTSGSTTENPKEIPKTPIDEPSVGSIENIDNDEGGNKKRISRKGTQLSEFRRKNRPDSLKLKRYSSHHKSDNLDDNLSSSTASSPTHPLYSPSPIKVEPEHPIYSKEEFFKYPIECPICFLVSNNYFYCEY